MGWCKFFWGIKDYINEGEVWMKDWIVWDFIGVFYIEW